MAQLPGNSAKARTARHGRLTLDRAKGSPLRQRAAHYRQPADNLLQMAEVELVERIRIVLRETAAQYQKLADYLNRPGKSDAD
jgi:hypothetical protein